MITLIINGRNFAGRISTFEPVFKTTYPKMITTISGDEYVSNKQVKRELNFSLLPYTDANCEADYEALSGTVLTVVYTDPTNGGNNTVCKMRVTTDLNHVFLLDSVNGNRYYKGGVITLRETSVV